MCCVSAETTCVSGVVDLGAAFSSKHLRVSPTKGFFLTKPTTCFSLFYAFLFYSFSPQTSAADTIHTGPWTWGQILSFIKISACETDYGPVEGEIKVTVCAEMVFFCSIWWNMGVWATWCRIHTVIELVSCSLDSKKGIVPHSPLQRNMRDLQHFQICV